MKPTRTQLTTPRAIELVAPLSERDRALLVRVIQSMPTEHDRQQLRERAHQQWLREQRASRSKVR